MQSWVDIVVCLDPYKKAPEWDVLETNLRSARAVMKPFSRPPIMRDADGFMIGRDITENALLLFQTVRHNGHALQVAEMLVAGVRTPAQFDRVEEHLDSLQAQCPGAMGTYRRHHNYDIWVEAKAISKNALRSYPVAQQSGTASSLKVIYGIPSKKALSESMLRQLLVHLYHQVRSTDGFSHRSDSLATMTLTLCGWHRAKGTVLGWSAPSPWRRQSIWKSEQN